MARAARQDSSRFDELCERVAPALVAWAELKVGAKLRGSIEPMDVVQETWCRAWRSFETYDPEAASFRAWTFRIAKNVVLECARRSRRDSAADAGTTARHEVVHAAPDRATALSRRLARDEGVSSLLEWARAAVVSKNSAVRAQKARKILATGHATGTPPAPDTAGCGTISLPAHPRA